MMQSNSKSLHEKIDDGWELLDYLRWFL